MREVADKEIKMKGSRRHIKPIMFILPRNRTQPEFRIFFAVVIQTR